MSPGKAELQQSSFWRLIRNQNTSQHSLQDRTFQLLKVIMASIIIICFNTLKVRREMKRFLLQSSPPQRCSHTFFWLKCSVLRQTAFHLFSPLSLGISLSDLATLLLFVMWGRHNRPQVRSSSPVWLQPNQSSRSAWIALRNQHRAAP